MKSITAALLIAIGIVPGVCAAEGMPAPAAAMSDKERVDYLIKQTQMLVEENARLKSQCDRPKTKEEAFVACMQAAKGETGAMAAESIGGHCDQLLK